MRRGCRDSGRAGRTDGYAHCHNIRPAFGGHVVSSERLSQKTVILTGGAGEIGQSIARALLAEGAIVLLTGRTESKLRDLHAALKTELPDRAANIHFKAADSAKEGDLIALADFAREKFGHIDVLINNAGSAGFIGQVSELALETPAGGGESLGDSMRSLLVGPWFTTRAILPLLAPNASIINVSSIFSRTPYYGRSAYTVPKAALNALAKLMATELTADPRGIRINTIYPGPVETNRIRRVMSAMDTLKKATEGTTKSAILNQMLLRQEATTEFVPRENVANTVVFLCSKDSQGFTAHDFEVTKGMVVAVEEPTRLPLDLKSARANPAISRFVWIVAAGQVEEVSTAIESVRSPGTEVLVTFSDRQAFESSKKKLEAVGGVRTRYWNPHDLAQWPELQETLLSSSAAHWACMVLLEDFDVKGLQSFAASACADIQRFVKDQLETGMIIAKRIEQMLKAHDSKFFADPTVIYVHFSATGMAAKLQDMRRAAFRQLLRVWRDEAEVDHQLSGRKHIVNLNQVLGSRRKNPIKSSIFIECAALFCISRQSIRQLDLIIDQDVVDSRIADSGYASVSRNLVSPGIHSDCVAVITGGSEGIGGAITRQLARAGVRIVIAERNADKLKRTRDSLVREMTELGFTDAEHRILTMADSNVTKQETLAPVIERTITQFGRVDFVINNAGLVGAEEMTVDIPADVWDQTLFGNMTSNYQLLLSALPHMLRQRCGHVINMSSYFGGSRNGVVPYTNRADYAVSKSGQIALAQALAELIGPDVQINALAPGPVEGARLNGTEGRPGLYQRRARLLNENRRLNDVYRAAVECLREGAQLEMVLEILAMNRFETVLARAGASLGPISRLVRKFQADPKDAGAPGFDYLLSKTQFPKAVARLMEHGATRRHRMTPEAVERILASFSEPPEPFWDPVRLEREAVAIRDRMVASIALKRMPTDNALALEVVSSLAHRTLTGEVIYPSCGFQYEGHYVGDSFRGDGVNLGVHLGLDTKFLKDHVAGQLVFLLAGTMIDEVATLAGRYSEAGAKVVMLDFGGRATVSFAKRGVKAEIYECSGQNVQAAFDEARARFGAPDVVVSFPLAALGQYTGRSTGEFKFLPTLEEFKHLVDTNVSNHFLAMQRACVIDGCRFVLVCPTMDGPDKVERKRWVRFLRTTLKPLVLAAGKEATHLPHGSMLFQIGADTADEAFFDSILLASIPAVRKTVESVGRKAA